MVGATFSCGSFPACVAPSYALLQTTLRILCNTIDPTPADPRPVWQLCAEQVVWASEGLHGSGRDP